MSLYDTNVYEPIYGEPDFALEDARSSLADVDLASLQLLQVPPEKTLKKNLEPRTSGPPQYLAQQWSVSRPPSYMSNPDDFTEPLVLTNSLSYLPHGSAEDTEKSSPESTRNVPSMTRRILIASPSIMSFLTWASMLVYFQVYFLGLEREDDGSFPRIGFTYGGYPFISCIGAIETTAFQICCIIVACCTWWVFTWDFLIGMRARRFASMKNQSWFYIVARSLKLFAAFCGGAFLIGLSYANVEDGSKHDTHLILTTLQVIGMGGTRFWDFFTTRELVKRIEANGGEKPKTMAQSKAVKNLEGAICIMGACVLLPAIYGCGSAGEIVSASPMVVKQSGRCFGLLSYAAVIEWIMSITWLFYMLSNAWDIVFLWDWIEAVRPVPANWREVRDPMSGRSRGHRRLFSGTRGVQ